MTQKYILTWKEFQQRKAEAWGNVCDKLLERIEHGRNKLNLDLDFFPIANRWNKIPFSFSISSCTGTPSEHGFSRNEKIEDKKYFPNAYIVAYSYAEHPLTLEFGDFLKSSFEGVCHVHNRPHPGEGYGGIYLHNIDIFVPFEKKEELRYLNDVWHNFGNKLDDYIRQNKLRDEWKWSGR